MLINVISNAVKYTIKGYVKIVTRLLEPGLIKIEVVDTGVGIKQHELPTIFDVFKKIKDNRELNKMGCGLGLSITKKLLVAMGGNIKV